jgi:hypothetical protein
MLGSWRLQHTVNGCVRLTQPRLCYGLHGNTNMLPAIPSLVNPIFLTHAEVLLRR